MIQKAKAKRELEEIAFGNRSTSLRLPQAMAAKLIKADNKNKNKSKRVEAMFLSKAEYKENARKRQRRRLDSLALAVALSVE